MDHNREVEPSASFFDKIVKIKRAIEAEGIPYTYLVKYRMHLNLEKCTFRVGEGKFLGFMITHQGIEANLNKCTSFMEMRSPTNIQEV